MLKTIFSTKVTQINVKKEVEHLFLLGVFERSNDSEWGDPYFAQPKPKINRIFFLSNFRNLNKQLKRKPYPMPKINEILLKLGCFQYAASLDLNVGYYHIRLTEDARNFYVLLFSLGRIPLQTSGNVIF